MRRANKEDEQKHEREDVRKHRPTIKPSNKANRSKTEELDKVFLRGTKVMYRVIVPNDEATLFIPANCMVEFAS